MNIASWMSLKHVLRLAGLLHFVQVPAMLYAPRMLDWESDLSKISVINRRIVQVMGGAIMLTVLGTGLVVAVGSDDLAAGGTLATALCVFMCVFWTYRAAVQMFLYSRIWPQGALGRISHYALCVLFSFLSVVYMWASRTSMFGHG